MTHSACYLQDDSFWSLDEDSHGKMIKLELEKMKRYQQWEYLGTAIANAWLIIYSMLLAPDSASSKMACMPC